jgi:hypothetical protein
MTKRLVLAAVAMSLVAGIAIAKNKEYEAANFADPAVVAKQAKKLIKGSNTKRIRKLEPKKVTIPEFTVAYLSKEKTETGAKKRLVTGKLFGGRINPLDIAKAAAEESGIGERNIVIDGAVRQEVTDIMYDLFAEGLTKAGFEVVDHETLKASSTGDFTTRETSNIMAAYGLGPLKAGPFSSISNAKSEARLMATVPVDMALHVKIAVEVDKDGRAVLEQRSVTAASAGVNESQWPNGKPIYNLKQSGQINLKAGLAYPEAIVDQSEWKLAEGKVVTVDGERLEAAIRALFGAYSALVAHELSK